eukprot:gnl/Dysnectes_brevis/768_a846_7854.p1 GENE.gnl/Dysnectes_brevis/768_a846_7854~~gnl/Dysnectes_brevis/768_a846_7854.p1  ORF type:complete len:176 (+),score=42.24 gnl/Dysnectes_brevis/768_a846_7854:47-574(+)
MSKTLIILSHPTFEKSRLNKTLIAKATEADNITLRHLDTLYPTGITPEGIIVEQELLVAHETVYFVFPLYWYSSPPSLKQYLDLVFTYGFAYGSKGKALQGKKLRVCVTTGGPSVAYSVHDPENSKFTIKDLLSPFFATAGMVGMEMLPMFVVHGAHGISDEELDKRAEELKTLI